MKKYFSAPSISFFELPKSTYILLITFLIFHLFLAWYWPILNDESYYWDWARNIQLSYVDAPPAVSWIAFLGEHLFQGSFGARFLVPFLSFFTAIFLVKSSEVLLSSWPRDDMTKQLSFEWIANISIIIFVAIPIFNINGILLMPDAPLLFACAGALYFALKSCEKFICDKGSSLSLFHACMLGIFIGFGIVSKYQGVPLAIGLFFAIVCIRGFKRTIQKDILFWTMTILCALIVSSPLFIWNIQNNFASFKFQGQHGFSSWHLNIPNFILYMLGTFLILLPWYSYLFGKQIVRSCKNKVFFQTLDVIPIFAFLSIFLFIGSAALGNESQTHWITPSVLFLIPLVAANWEALTSKHRNFWKNISIVSIIIISFVCLVTFTQPVQNFLSQDKTIFGFKISQIHSGLYGNLTWLQMADAEQNIKKFVPEIALTEKNYFYDLKQTKCSEEPYLASFNWRWTSQFAFYLKNNPRVFSFNLKRTTYYSWRDSLPLLAGCHFFVVGLKSMYNEKELKRIMNIQSVKEFTIPKNYSHKSMEMIFIDGIMKDSKTLEEISEKLLLNARF